MNEDADIFRAGSLPQRIALLQRLLQEARIENDALQPEMKTNFIRGEVAAYKRLLAFLTGETPDVDGEPHY